MFEAADIREWRGHDVVDPEDNKIGEMAAIYVDTSTDELPAADEKAIFKHYGLTYQPGISGERQLARR